MQEGSDSSIFKKLLKKPSGIIALCIIGLTAILSVFAYFFAPDNTPYANRMIIELGAKPPGFTKQLLFIPKTTVLE